MYYICRMRIIRVLAYCLTVAILSGFLSGCGASRQVSGRGGTSLAPVRPVEAVAADTQGELPSMTAVLSEARSWLGISYQYGGNTRSGVDCSGLVLQVYLNALDIKLPRTSLQQQQFCQPIVKSALRPGDLVFFTVRGGSKVGHVGIYIGEGNMIHASSTKGVIVTPLSNPYFEKNFHSCGRIQAYDTRLRAEAQSAEDRAPVAQPVPSAPAEPQRNVSVVDDEPTAAPAPRRKIRVAPRQPQVTASIDNDFFD